VKLGAVIATPYSLRVTSAAATSIRVFPVETKYFKFVISDTKTAGSLPILPSFRSKAIPSGLASVPCSFHKLIASGLEMIFPVL
jgi:hypothetical protein